MSLAALRQQLVVLVDPPRAGTAAVSTGIAALDGALSAGGVPCGRLTEILGGSRSGRTTLTRQLVTAATAAGRWVAYVDGTRTLSPRDWTAIAGTRRFWIIRPPNANRGAWCADVLLRSGAFGMVVLDGGPPLPRPVALRLTRLARDHDTALVIVGAEGTIVGSAVRLRVVRGPKSEVRGPRESRISRTGGPGSSSPATDPSLRSGQALGPRTSGSVIRITVEKGGLHQSVEVSCAIDMARRLCAHPEVPDRRGVAARDRWGHRPQAGDRRACPERSSQRSTRRQHPAPATGKQLQPPAISTQRVSDPRPPGLVVRAGCR